MKEYLISSNFKKLILKATWPCIKCRSVELEVTGMVWKGNYKPDTKMSGDKPTCTVVGVSYFGWNSIDYYQITVKVSLKTPKGDRDALVTYHSKLSFNEEQRHGLALPSFDCTTQPSL